MLKLLTFRVGSVLKPGLLLPSNKILDVSTSFRDTAAVISGRKTLEKLNIKDNAECYGFFSPDTQPHLQLTLDTQPLQLTLDTSSF
jgi:hypothetical protein